MNVYCVTTCLIFIGMGLLRKPTLGVLDGGVLVFVTKSILQSLEVLSVNRIIYNTINPLQEINGKVVLTW